jgi:hypothetical protein
MNNIVTFPDSQARDRFRQKSHTDEKPMMLVPEPGWMRRLRFAKNPLRQHVTSLSIAIVEANKLDEFIDGEALKWIRKGVDAARILADELGSLADRLEG